MNDDDKPSFRISVPAVSGKGVGMVIPELLATDMPIVVVDRRCDLRRFYGQGDDA